MRSKFDVKLTPPRVSEYSQLLRDIGLKTFDLAFTIALGLQYFWLPLGTVKQKKWMPQKSLGYSICDSGSLPKEFRILCKTLKLTSEGPTNFAEVVEVNILEAFLWREVGNNTQFAYVYKTDFETQLRTFADK